MICSPDGMPSPSADGSGQAESDDHPACVVLWCVPTDRPRWGNIFVNTQYRALREIYLL